MQIQAVELNNVIYNAASQNFEALATVYAGSSSRRFQGAAGLSSSHPASIPAPQVRAGRSSPHKIMDAFEMLRNLAA